jgi:hypothetical protein
MVTTVSVQIEMLEDPTFALPIHLNESDGVPMFGGDSDVSFINSPFSFSREVSRTYGRSDSFKDILDLPMLSRENSKSIAGNIDILILGREETGIKMTRENSDSVGLSMPRENSGFLGSLVREISTDLGKLHTGETAYSLDVSCLGVQDIAGPEDQTVLSSQESPDTAGGLHRPIPTPAASPRPRGEPRESRRGAHVKTRPDMQQTARDGAAHWAKHVKTMRSTWADRAAERPAFAAKYAQQIAAAHGRIKAKQECLLRFLQLAADDGVITPAPFDLGGFFGWARFVVAPGRGAEFRLALERLFPKGFKEDTLKETFRRAGLIPQGFQWDMGWQGGAAFEFRQRSSP